VRTGMIHQANRLFTLVLLGALVAGCGGSEGLSPTSETPLASTPTDTTTVADSTLAAPIDSTLGSPSDTASGSPSDTAEAAGLAPGTTAVSVAPGIVFGTFSMKTELLGTVHTGSRRAPGPGNIVDLLTGARAKAARMVISLTGGDLNNIKNSDGTFSLTKWKAKVAEFRYVAFGSFISDGTVLVHYLIDEPNNPSKWGGKIIPQATIEAMAKYSKSIWPGMTTVARVVPSWLASAPVT
jgi:hypothetical protein